MFKRETVPDIREEECRRLAEEKKRARTKMVKKKTKLTKILEDVKRGHSNPDN